MKAKKTNKPQKPLTSLKATLKAKVDKKKKKKKSPSPTPTPTLLPPSPPVSAQGGEYAGPVVRICKTNTGQLKYTVLNSRAEKKEGDDRSQLVGSGRRLGSGKTTSPPPPPPPPILPALAPEEGENTSSGEWKCYICDRKSNCRLKQMAMGDLYGPYFMDENYSLWRPGDQSCSNGDHHMPAKREEIWLHEDCFIWTPNLLLVQEHISNFDTVMKEISAERCLHCQKPRPILGCRHRGCRYSALHFPCAKELDFHLDEKTHTVYCPEHSAPPPPPPSPQLPPPPPATKNKQRRPEGKSAAKVPNCKLPPPPADQQQQLPQLLFPQELPLSQLSNF